MNQELQKMYHARILNQSGCWHDHAMRLSTTTRGWIDMASQRLQDNLGEHLIPGVVPKLTTLIF